MKKNKIRDNKTKDWAISQGDFEKFKFEIVNLFKELKKDIKNDIYNFKDAILTEIVKLRDDMTVTKNYGDRLENHEQRINKLENKNLQQ